MSCEICGRGSCTRSFHSLSDQADYDLKQEMSDNVDELRDEVLDLRSQLEESKLSQSALHLRISELEMEKGGGNE